MLNVVIPLISLGSIPLVSHPCLLQKSLWWVLGSLFNTHTPFAILISSPHLLTYNRQQAVFPSVFFLKPFVDLSCLLLFVPNSTSAFYLIFDTFLLVCYKLLFYYIYPFSCMFEVFAGICISLVPMEVRRRQRRQCQGAVNYNVGALNFWALSTPCHRVLTGRKYTDYMPWKFPWCMMSTRAGGTLSIIFARWIFGKLCLLRIFIELQKLKDILGRTTNRKTIISHKFYLRIFKTTDFYCFEKE